MFCVFDVVRLFIMKEIVKRTENKTAWNTKKRQKKRLWQKDIAFKRNKSRRSY